MSLKSVDVKVVAGGGAGARKSTLHAPFSLMIFFEVVSKIQVEHEESSLKYGHRSIQ